MRKLRSLTILYCRLGSRVHTSQVKLRALSDSADSRQLGHGVGAAACAAPGSGGAGFAGAALARAAAGSGGHGLAGLTAALASPAAKARPPTGSRA
jgi:hypothetical protein